MSCCAYWCQSCGRCWVFPRRTGAGIFSFSAPHRPAAARLPSIPRSGDGQCPSRSQQEDPTDDLRRGPAGRRPQPRRSISSCGDAAGQKVGRAAGCCSCAARSRRQDIAAALIPLRPPTTSINGGDQSPHAAARAVCFLTAFRRRPRAALLRSFHADRRIGGDGPLCRFPSHGRSSSSR